MNILITVATEGEVKPLLTKLEVSDREFEFNGHNIQILISGVGMVSTIYHLTSILSSDTAFDLILNIGVAGSFTKELELGTVAQVISDQIIELGAEDGLHFIPAIDLGFIDKEEAILHNNCGIRNEVIDRLVTVNGITVNTVHGEEGSIAKIKTRSNAQVESMEGAAFFYVCKKENQACAQIRAISNYIETRDKDQWEMEKAIQNLSTVTLDILRTI